MSSGQRHARRATRRNEGLTMIEVSLLLCVAGILLAVSTPAFVRALRTSKLGEATGELQRIYAATSAYYAQSHATETGQRHHCLPRSAGPTPAQPSQHPVAIEFGTRQTADGASWRALDYEPTGPIRYRYSLRVAHPDCAVPRDSHGEFVVTVRAEGDLDGDGVLSSFERHAGVKNGELELDPLLEVRDAVE